MTTNLQSILLAAFTACGIMTMTSCEAIEEMAHGKRYNTSGQWVAHGQQATTHSSYYQPRVYDARLRTQAMSRLAQKSPTHSYRSNSVPATASMKNYCPAGYELRNGGHWIKIGTNHLTDPKWNHHPQCPGCHGH